MMMYLDGHFIYICLLSLSFITKVVCCKDLVTKTTANSSDIQALFNDLFCEYNKNVRPVLHHEEVTIVQFEIALFNVLSLETKVQKLMTNTEMIMKWEDHYLTWNPADYNGTKLIRVPYESIWYPDIVLYNTADANYRSGLTGTNAIIFHTGEVELVIHAMLKSTCELNIMWYPFDQQDCKLVFASWTYDITQVQLINSPADLSEYGPNPEFYLENFYSDLTEEHDPCCVHSFSTVTYHIQLQRRTMFAIYFFIMPGTIVNLCALLTFLLPAESGEKISLATNALLAMMVFLMAMTQDIPPTEHVPLIGRYYGGCIGILALNIAASVCALSCYFSSDVPMSKPLSFLARSLGRIAFVTPPEDVKRKWEVEFNSKVVCMKPSDLAVKKMKFRELTLRSDYIHLQLSRMVAQMSDGPIPDFIRVEPKREGTRISQDDYNRRSLEALEGIHLLLLDGAHKKLKGAKSGGTSSIPVNIQEWRYLCKVTDRCLFVLFVVSFIIFNFAILFVTPHTNSFEYCPEGPGTCPEDWDADVMQDILESGEGLYFH